MPTWWCGDEASRAEVLADLDRVILRALTPDSGLGSTPGTRLFPPLLSSADREALRAAVEARPGSWAAEEYSEASTAPVVHDGRLALPAGSSCAASWWPDGDDWDVLPGGLARVRFDASRASRRPRCPERRVGAGRRAAPARRAGAHPAPDRPRDVAAEPQRRGPVLDGPPRRGGRDGHPAGADDRRRARRDTGAGHRRRRRLGDDVLRCAGLDVRAAPLPAEFPAQRVNRDTAPGDGALAPPILRRVLVDDSLPRSLVGSLAELLAASLSARELVSTHTGQVLAMLEDRLDALRSASSPAEIEEIAGATLINLMALVGLSAESMVRDPGYLMSDIGRRLERARLLVRILLETLVPVPDPDIAGLTHETLLACCESLVAYRRRYRSDIEVEALSSLLVTDHSNPRSLAFQADRLMADLRRLPGDPPEGALQPLGSVLERLLVADLGRLLAPSRGRRTGLQDLAPRHRRRPRTGGRSGEPDLLRPRPRPAGGPAVRWSGGAVKLAVRHETRFTYDGAGHPRPERGAGPSPGHGDAGRALRRTRRRTPRPTTSPSTSTSSATGWCTWRWPVPIRCWR